MDVAFLLLRAPAPLRGKNMKKFDNRKKSKEQERSMVYGARELVYPTVVQVLCLIPSHGMGFPHLILQKVLVTTEIPELIFPIKRNFMTGEKMRRAIGAQPLIAWCPRFEADNICP